MKKTVTISNKKGLPIIYIKWFLIFSIALLLWLTFLPVIYQEIKYQYHKIVGNIPPGISGNKTNIDLVNTNLKYTPPNYDFAIVIPKINVSAPIYANVDPFNEKEFRQVLKQGVAHAKGTAHPGEIGNSFIFAHSTDIFDNVTKYNAIFYLIGKLDKGDEVYVYYKNQKFVFTVYDKKVVSADSLQYLKPLIPDKKTLTLSTCYPPGTTWKRLVVLLENL